MGYHKYQNSEDDCRQVYIKFDEADCEGRWFLLSSRQLSSEIKVIVGRPEDDALAIAFGTGSIDTYAVFIIVYRNGVGYVYYPGDMDWLLAFDIVLGEMCQSLNEMSAKRQMMNTLGQIVLHVVGRNTVVDDDFLFLQDLLSSYIQYGNRVYWTMFYWCTWFLYACVAEESKVIYGRPTIVGGLVKMVAWIEHVIEGQSLDYVCNHYKGEFYKSVYQGSYDRPSDEILAVCKAYGLERRLL